MQNLRYIYEDPTGGGDDITLTAPAWADVPDYLIIRDAERNRLEFTLLDDEPEEVDA